MKLDDELRRTTTCFGMRAHDAGNGAFVRQSKPRVSELCGSFDQFLGVRSST